MSWKLVPLRNVASIQRQIVDAKDIASGTKYLGLEHIESGGAILGSRIVDSGDLSSSKFKFSDSHVLYGKLRPYLAKIASPDFHGICSTDILPIKPDASLDKRYLVHFLRQPSMIDFANSRSIGANLPRISPNAIEEFQIPLPPLPEQKRIAAILDQADALRRKRQQAIERLNHLGQAIFYEMFGEFLHAASRKKTTRRLIELADISSGVTKGRKLGVEPTRELPYMAVVNVQDKFLALENVKTIEATESEIKRYLLKKGDLLLTEGGDPDKLGRGVLWNDELAECIHQNHIFRVRVTSSELNPVFLSWLVASPSGKDYFLRSSKQTTGIASINKTQLGEFPVALPSKTDQKVFAERLTQIKSQTELASIGHLKIDALFQSLQSRAFSGAL
jgi:type I restriction enzyme, S subunit